MQVPQGPILKLDLFMGKKDGHPHADKTFPVFFLYLWSVSTALADKGAPFSSCSSSRWFFETFNGPWAPHVSRQCRSHCIPQGLLTCFFFCHSIEIARLPSINPDCEEFLLTGLEKWVHVNAECVVYAYSFKYVYLETSHLIEKLTVDNYVSLFFTKGKKK